MEPTAPSLATARDENGEAEALRRRAAFAKEVAELEATIMLEELSRFVEAVCRHGARQRVAAAAVAPPDAGFLGGCGHFLACLREGRLWGLARELAAEAGLEFASLLPAALPPDLSPLRDEELLPRLVGGALVYHRPRFLNRQADRYLEALRPGGGAGIPWERRKLMMFGREVNEGHPTAFYGDSGTSYKYSGKEHAPLPWDADPTGTLAELLWMAREVTGQPFNFCLCNYYDPMDRIGPHSDDEKDLVSPFIFSVSLGRTRMFELLPRAEFAVHTGVRLVHGSALVMAGATQRAYKHQVEAEKPRPGEPGPLYRVNLTFRCVRARRPQ